MTTRRHITAAGEMTEADWLKLIAEDPAANLPWFERWLQDELDDKAGVSFCKYMQTKVRRSRFNKGVRRPNRWEDREWWWTNGTAKRDYEPTNILPLAVWQRLTGKKSSYYKDGATAEYENVPITKPWEDALRAWRETYAAGEIK